MSVSASNSSQVQQSHHRHGHGAGLKQGMDAAAKALGMSTDDLKSQLKSGKSLEDIAKQNGVSTDKLKSAISDALSQANPRLSAGRANEIAQRLFQGPPSGPTGASAL